MQAVDAAARNKAASRSGLKLQVTGGWRASGDVVPNHREAPECVTRRPYGAPVASPLLLVAGTSQP